MSRPRHPLAVDATLLAVAVVWGSSYLAAKDLTVIAPVLVVLALRYVISTAGLLLLCARTRPARPRRGDLGAGTLLGFTQAGVLVLETFGVAHTSATNAGLIISLTVVLTPAVDNAWSRTWLPAPFFVATALAVLGVALLVSGHGFHAPTWGDALMLAAAAVRAVHVTLIGRSSRTRATDTVTLTTIQSATGAAILCALAGSQLGPALAHLPTRSWFGLAYLGLACSVFAFVAQTWAVRRTSPSRASLLMGTEPVWAVAVGVGLGGEHLTPVAAAGAALVVVASFWGQRVESRHRTRIETAEQAAHLAVGAAV